MPTSITPSTLPWARPQGLLFDAMGTLITLRQSVGFSYAAVAQAHGLSVDAAAIDTLFPQI
ncbi:MAG: haloacid dehalogenase, partial [Cyanobacteria bacterium K_DeepCast_35m_m2_023]|nr:haloacid dehalogenase [Cyanobacteria bacterium K_DeepCast_35m_m2_023]